MTQVVGDVFDVVAHSLEASYHTGGHPGAIDAWCARLDFRVEPYVLSRPPYGCQQVGSELDRTQKGRSPAGWDHDQGRELACLRRFCGR